MRRLIAISALLAAVLAGPAAAHQELLAGGDWVLSGESGRNAPFLRFDAGRVAGSGGCNRFGGTYKLSGDSLSFSPLAATRKACMGGAMKSEQLFFDMLGQVRGMKLDGDTLRLLDDSGKVIATLTKRVAE